MESERYQRVERLFHEALALAPDDRSIYIDHGAAGDADVAARVRRMIEFAEQPSATAGMLDDSSPAGDDMDEASALLGAWLGPYRLAEVIGAGGFGVVYRAEQEQPLRRSVALKILRGGMDSRQVITRFEGERQALALMEHPNIARVLDAGRTPQNLGLRPYFVMELVGGLPLTEYCDSKRLDAEARLDLFLTICDAVQHAHQKGIIHRDLKPSNIVVAEIGGKPMPKIIDFGIAKALEQRLTERTLVTDAQQLLGTPQYMSPEQADMGAAGIDTRSDIYSLGVILYELLTGTTPLRAAALHQASYTQMQRLIQSEVVERPSTRVTRGEGKGEGDHDATLRAQHRDTNVASLQRRLRGDLDWIMLKALEHNRERRYSSASALADDIRRHQRHEPVLAGPPSAAYRTRKFVRRHRLSVIAASLVGLAIIGGITGVMLAMMRAQEAADQSRQISSFLGDVLTSASPDRRGTEVRLAEVLENASSDAARRFASHPNLEADVRETLGYAFLKLTLPRQATREYRRALELRQTVHGADALRTLFSQTYYVKALINEASVGEAERVLADAMPRLESYRASSPALWNDAQLLQAGVYRLRGSLDEAERVLRPLRLEPDQTTAGDGLQIPVLDGLIRVLLARGGQGPEADRLRLTEIVSLADEMADRCARFIGPDAEGTMHARTMLADASSRLGEVGRAREILDGLIPQIVARVGKCHQLYLDAIKVHARVQNRLGASAFAAQLLLDGIDCIRAREGRSLSLVAVLGDAMPYLDRGGLWADGEALSREYAELLREFGGGHGDLMFVADLYIARFAALQGRHDEARSLAQALEARLAKETDDPATIARFHALSARLLVAQGRFRDAEERLNMASALVGDIRQGTSAAFPDDIIAEFIALYQAWSKPEKAEQYQRLRDEAMTSADTSG